MLDRLTRYTAALADDAGSIDVGRPHGLACIAPDVP